MSAATVSATPAEPRFPLVIHEYGDVRHGRVLGHRPEWNDLEKDILRAVVNRRLREGSDTDAGSIFEEIFHHYPDWQRSEHAIKAKLPDFIKECFEEQKRLAAQTGTALSDLDRNFNARMEQAVREAKEAGIREAENLKNQIAELKVHLQNQLAANARLETDHAMEINRLNKRQRTRTAMFGAVYALSQNPSMLDRLGNNSRFMQSLEHIANTGADVIGNIEDIPALPSATD